MRLAIVDDPLFHRAHQILHGTVDAGKFLRDELSSDVALTSRAPAHRAATLRQSVGIQFLLFRTSSPLHALHVLISFFTGSSGNILFRVVLRYECHAA